MRSVVSVVETDTTVSEVAAKDLDCEFIALSVRFHFHGKRLHAEPRQTGWPNAGRNVRIADEGKPSPLSRGAAPRPP